VPVDAVVGAIALSEAKYLICISGSRPLGTILGKELYLLTEATILPITPEPEELSFHAQEELDLLHSLLASESFYFSYTYDVTNSLQRQKHAISLQKEEVDHSDSVWPFHKADHRFYWNRHLQEALIEQLEKASSVALAHYVVPLTQGFVFTDDCELDNKKFFFGLVSRRSHHRAGTRYFKRGADLDGHVANYVETEQIVIHENKVSSFIQVRGSVPVVWQQQINLKYEPSIEVHDPHDEVSLKIFLHHFEKQIAIYGKQTIVNLLKKSGSESRLGSAYEILYHKCDSHKETGKLVYHAFDLHKECGVSKYEKMNTLFDALNDTVEHYSFYLSDGEEDKLQQGVVRTNCKDNLDRTNLFQSKLARRQFWKQLAAVFSDKEILDFPPLEDKTKIERMLRYAWADNGDAISIQYSGTAAVRGDVTRDGKGTVKGLFNDAVSSITRYYLNNFQDASKQDAIDLFVGRYVPSLRPTPEEVPSSFLTVPILAILSIFNNARPKTGAVPSFLQFLVILGWLLVLNLLLLIGSLFSKGFGRRLVAKPKYLEEDDIKKMQIQPTYKKHHLRKW